MNSPFVAVCALALAMPALAANFATLTELDHEVAAAMTATQTRGLAIALIDQGDVVQTRAYGVRNAACDPLTEHTVMYGASLTKSVFSYLLMQLIDDGAIELDRSIADYLRKPLPDYPFEEGYGPWQDLAGDERWRAITPRILLSHGAGFANFAFLEPDQKLQFHFAPGTGYAYSGEGYILLQFVLARGLGIDVGAAMQERIFKRLGMTRTSMIWRDDFADDLADGCDISGKPVVHDQRSRVRAAGSMDTTITDFARFAAAFVRGIGLTQVARIEITALGLPIRSKSQFPTLQDASPADEQIPGLRAGLGVVTFTGPQGRGFMKGGHNDSTANMWVCLETPQRCIVLLSNDVRAEAAFPRLVALALGETGAPWRWEYGDMAFWLGPEKSSR